MHESPTLSDDEWPGPVLDRAGQEAFWDRQVLGYDQADMTRDNEGELDLVRALCQQFCLCGYQADDVVTLGGAVGSRDPKVVMEVLERHNKWPKRIIFNDLSRPMTEQALKVGLASYSSDRAELVVLPGPIHEIGEHVPVMPRRVIIGVYRAEAFTSSNPHYGYPLTGLEEYEKNADKIGSHLIIEPVHLTDTGYTSTDCRLIYTSGDCPEQKEFVRSQLVQCLDSASIDAIRVIGRHRGQSGYFLSHWFTEQGIRRLITGCFNPVRITSMSLMACAKGYVLCIDPVEKPRGVITILNNVIGNVIPNEQMETLRMVDKLSS